MSRMAELQLDCWRAQHEPVPILKLNRQSYAVAKLVGYCEAIAGSGLLGEESETQLRQRIAETLTAFNMEPHQDAVKAEMEKRCELF